MAEFLSPAWLTELDDAARASGYLAVSAGEPLALEHEVRDSPHGDVRYHVTADASGTRFHRGPADAPTLTVVTDYATAIALHRGEINAQRAITTGRALVRGDLAGLVRHAEALSAIDDVFAKVRAATTYAPEHGRRERE